MIRKLLTLALLPFIIISPCMAQSWCGIQTLYFQHNETTTPAGYEELINYPSGNAEVDENVTVINTGGPVLIDNYIMPENALLHTSSLLMGLRTYRIYTYVDGASGVTQLNFTAFRRFANGTEQNFYTAMSGDINDLSVTEYTFNYASQATLSLNPTDRLGIRVSANTSHSAPIKVHFVYQGTSHASNFMSGFFVCEDSTVVPGQLANDLPLPLAIPLLALIGVIALWSIRKR